MCLHCEGNIIYVVFLPKMFNLILNMKKQSNKTKLRGILKTTGLNSSKNVNVLKDKKKRLQEIKETRKSNVMHHDH